MTFDPFADEVQPEPVVETVTETNNSNVFTETVEVQTVTNPEGVTRVSLTFKAGTGFDSPWVVVEGGSVPGILADLKATPAEVGELFGLVANGARSLQKAYGGNAPSAPAAQPQAQSRPPQQQAPSGEGKTCNHGEMIFRSGVSQKTGKPWKGFFCPTPKGTPGQCDAQFVR